MCSGVVFTLVISLQLIRMYFSQFRPKGLGPSSSTITSTSLACWPSILHIHMEVAYHSYWLLSIGCQHYGRLVYSGIWKHPLPCGFWNDLLPWVVSCDSPALDRIRRTQLVQPVLVITTDFRVGWWCLLLYAVVAAQFPYVPSLLGLSLWDFSLPFWSTHGDYYYVWLSCRYGIQRLQREFALSCRMVSVAVSVIARSLSQFRGVTGNFFIDGSVDLKDLVFVSAASMAFAISTHRWGSSRKVVTVVYCHGVIHTNLSRRASSSVSPNLQYVASFRRAATYSMRV